MMHCDMALSHSCKHSQVANKKSAYLEYAAAFRAKTPGYAPPQPPVAAKFVTFKAVPSSERWMQFISSALVSKGITKFLPYYTIEAVA